MPHSLKTSLLDYKQHSHERGSHGGGYPRHGAVEAGRDAGVWRKESSIILVLSQLFTRDARPSTGCKQSSPHMVRAALSCPWSALQDVKWQGERGASVAAAILATTPGIELRGLQS